MSLKKYWPLNAYPGRFGDFLLAKENATNEDCAQLSHRVEVHTQKYDLWCDTMKYRGNLACLTFGTIGLIGALKKRHVAGVAIFTGVASISAALAQSRLASIHVGASRLKQLLPE